MKALFKVNDRVQLQPTDVMYRLRESESPDKTGPITGKIVEKGNWRECRKREVTDKGGLYGVELDEKIDGSDEVWRYGNVLIKIPKKKK